MKIMLVVGVSGASAERSFNLLRRLKTYLRASMMQQRLTHLALMAIKNETCSEISAKSIAKDFICSSERERKFGHV